jgi:hypothetical protein
MNAINSNFGLNPDQVKALQKKWGEWLSKLPADKRKNSDFAKVMSVLYENQQKYNGRGLLKEAGVSTTDAGVFQKVILPVVHRVYPRLVAPELVGVTPMTGPHGVAIFLKYYYENGDQILQPGGNEDSYRVLFREWEPSSFLTVTPTVTSGAGYELEFDFTSSYVEPGAMHGTDVSWYSWNANAQLKFKVTVTSGSDTLTDVIVVQNTADLQATAPAWAATSLAGNFTFVTTTPTTSSEIYIDTYPTSYTQAGTGTAKLLFNFVFNSATTVAVQTQPLPGVGTNAAQAIFTEAVFIDSNNCPIISAKGLESQPPATLKMKFETKPIEAKTYKLQASWSIEANQDVSNLHGQDLEKLLADLLTNELLNATDYHVISQLMAIAGIKATWNKFAGIYQGLGVTTSGTTEMPAYRGTQRDHMETLLYTMNDVANAIAVKILRGPANFAVCAPDVATVIESIPGFTSSGKSYIDYDIGVKEKGTLQSKYKVFVDPRMPKGKLLMGYKGNDAQNTGYMFCPYIPATLGPVVWNPTTYDQSRLVFTRFGTTTMLDGSYFYGLITMTELHKATSDWTLL